MRHPAPRIAFSLGLLALTSLSHAQPRYPFLPGETDIGLTPFYVQSGWATIHRDSRNSSFAPFVAPTANRVSWTALDGAMTLAGPTIGPEGNLYITTGQGRGFSHLHAYDREGRLLWETAPQSTRNDLDSLALLSAPIVDASGDIYVSDSNQFWAFHPNGSLKWVVNLPAPDSAGSPGAFITAMITNQGFVGGITTEGAVALYNRADGTLAAPVLALPQTAVRTSVAVAAADSCAGTTDPAVMTIVSSVGGTGIVKNTPAVHPQTGRIYITAAGPTPTEGRIYGIDLINGSLQVTYQASMGANSGTSPSISPDGKQIYAVDGAGRLSAFDADTAALLWQYTGAAADAAPAVGPDGTVYTGGGGSSVIALDPVTGAERWRSNVDSLAASLLLPLPPVPPVVPTGQPVSQVNSVISVSATHIWATFVLGYEFVLPDRGELVQPRLTVVVSLDPISGTLIGHTVIRDTNEGQIPINKDGRLYSSHASILSSLFYCTIDPALNLPTEYRLPTPPLSGFTALEPQSFANHARAGIHWVQSLDAQALQNLPNGDISIALDATRRGHVQLDATAESVNEAAARGEIEPGAASEAGALVRSAEQQLLCARDLLTGKLMPNSHGADPKQLIQLAEQDLAKALELIGPERG